MRALTESDVEIAFRVLLAESGCASGCLIHAGLGCLALPARLNGASHPHPALPGATSWTTTTATSTSTPTPAKFMSRTPTRLPSLCPSKASTAFQPSPSTARRRAQKTGQPPRPCPTSGPSTRLPWQMFCEAHVSHLDYGGNRGAPRHLTCFQFFLFKGTSHRLCQLHCNCAGCGIPAWRRM